MFKKFLAGLTAIALSLGIVAFTAGPASAHHSTITASVVCTSPTAATITWSVQNWNGGKIGEVVSSTNNLVPAGTQFASNETKQYIQNVTSTGTYTLSVTMKWWDGDSWENQTTNSGSKQVNSSTFSDCAEVDPADPTFTNAQCTGPGTYGQATYTIPTTANVVYTVSINDGAYTVKVAGTYFVNVGTKVEVHAAAVSPYVIDGTDDWSKTFSTPDCDVDVTPTKPVIVQAVCTGESQVGQASYTIPSITGLKYQISSGGNNGPWTDIAAGVYFAADGSFVWIQAVELFGYDVNGTSKWKLDFDNIDSSKCDVPAPPTFTAQVCTGPGTSNTASYTIPSDSGIKYQVRINGGSWTTVSAGTVNVTVFPRLIEVQALADGNIIVPGSTTYWSFNFTAAGDCLVNVYPAAPNWVDSVCQSTTTGSTQATFQVFVTANVTYQVSTNGVDYAPIAAGVHNATVGTTVWIKAVPASGYVLAGDTGPWSHLFTDPGYCLDEAFPGDPLFVDSVCTGPGLSSQATYQIVAGTGITYEISFNGVDYTTVGASVGVHNATPGTHIWIKAIPLPGYQILGQTVWDHLFADPGDCLVEAYPVEPAWTDSVCEREDTGSTQATFEVFAAANVSYEVSTDGGTTWDPISTGVHNASPGDTIMIRAIPDSGYKLTSYTGPWSHLFTDPGYCLDEAFPGDPLFVDSICTGPGDSSQASYEIVAAINVSYEVSFDGVNYTTVGASVGVHNVATGTHIWVKAIADAGYEILGQTVWDHLFTDPGFCLEPATATPATAVDQECVVNENTTGSYVSGYLVIPNSANVEYFIDGSVTPEVPGQLTKVPGTYTVTAAPTTGYFLVGYTGPWVLEIVAAEPCGDLIVLPVVDPVVTFVQTTCSASGSYTLAVEPVEESAGVIWTVSGGLPNTLGTHSVSGAGTVTVTATAASGYGFSGDQDGVMDWSFDFAALPDDCLPTLALTGGSTAAGGLGLSALLTLGGILLLTARKRDALARGE